LIHQCIILLTFATWRIDAIGTVVIGAGHALAFWLRGPTLRMVDRTVVLIDTLTLVAHAAIVPSSAGRSLVLGAINLGSITIAM
jgi:hypothetical protein